MNYLYIWQCIPHSFAFFRLCPDGLYTYAVDIWSSGCILAEMLNRDPIFPGKNFIDQLSLVFDVIGSPRPDEVKHIVNEEAKKFLKAQAVKRKVPFRKIFPNASAEACELLEEMMFFSPDKRCDVDKALNHAFILPFHDQSNAMYNPQCLTFPPVNRQEFEFSFERNPNMTRLQLKNMINQEVTSFKREKYGSGKTGSKATVNGPVAPTSTAGGAAAAASSNAAGTTRKDSLSKHPKEDNTDNDSTTSGGTARLRRQPSDSHLRSTQKQGVFSNAHSTLAGVPVVSSTAPNNGQDKDVPTYLRGTASSAYRSNSAPKMRPGATAVGSTAGGSVIKPGKDQQNEPNLPPKPKQSIMDNRGIEKEKIITVDAAKVHAMIEEPDAYDILFNGSSKGAIGTGNKRTASSGIDNKPSKSNVPTSSDGHRMLHEVGSPMRSKDLLGTMDMLNKLYHEPHKIAVNESTASMKLRRSEAKEQDDMIERERAMKELEREFGDYVGMHARNNPINIGGKEQKERDDSDDGIRSEDLSQPKSPSGMRKSLRYEPSPQKTLRYSNSNNISNSNSNIPQPMPSFSPLSSPQRSSANNNAKPPGGGLPQPPQSPNGINRKSIMQTYTSPKVIASGPRASYNLDGNSITGNGINSTIPPSPVIVVNKKFPDLPSSPNRIIRSSNTDRAGSEGKNNDDEIDKRDNNVFRSSGTRDAVRESLSKAIQSTKGREECKEVTIENESDHDDESLEPSPVPYPSQPPKPFYSVLGGVASVNPTTQKMDYGQLYASKLAPSTNNAISHQAPSSSARPPIPPSGVIHPSNYTNEFDRVTEKENRQMGLRPSGIGDLTGTANATHHDKDNKQKKKITVPKSPKFSTMSWQKKQEQQGNQAGVGGGEDRRKSGVGLNGLNGTGIDKRRATSTGRMRL